MSEDERHITLDDLKEKYGLETHGHGVECTAWASSLGASLAGSGWIAVTVNPWLGVLLTLLSFAVNFGWWRLRREAMGMTEGELHG